MFVCNHCLLIAIAINNHDYFRNYTLAHSAYNILICELVNISNIYTDNPF